MGEGTPAGTRRTDKGDAVQVKVTTFIETDEGDAQEDVVRSVALAIHTVAGEQPGVVSHRTKVETLEFV